MGEIHIYAEHFVSKANELTTLATEIKNLSMIPPTTIGGGSTITKLEELGNEFVKLKDNIAALINETAIFINNMAVEYNETDKGISINMSGVGGGPKLVNQVNKIN